jgi:hypothetical protein
VDFWYFRISINALVPGLHLWRPVRSNRVPSVRAYLLLLLRQCLILTGLWCRAAMCEQLLAGWGRLLAGGSDGCIFGPLAALRLHARKLC